MRVFAFVDPGGYLLSSQQFAIVAAPRCRLRRSLLTGLPPRLFPHCGRSALPVSSQVRYALSLSRPERQRATSIQTKQIPCESRGFVLLDPGGYLLSRAVSSQVPSAYEGLTAVFGMGTGGSLQPNHRKVMVFFKHLENCIECNSF